MEVGAAHRAAGECIVGETHTSVGAVVDTELQVQPHQLLLHGTVRDVQHGGDGGHCGGWREGITVEHRRTQAEQHAALGEHINRGPAFRFSRSQDCQFAGPALGEHNRYVLGELLGMSDEEIAAAIREGGVTTAADLPEIKGAF